MFDFYSSKFSLEVMKKMVDIIVINDRNGDIQSLKREVINLILKHMIEKHSIPDNGFPLLWKLGVTPEEFNNLSFSEEIDVKIDSLSKRMYKKFFEKVFSESLELECITYVV